MNSALNYALQQIKKTQGKFFLPCQSWMLQQGFQVALARGRVEEPKLNVRWRADQFAALPLSAEPVTAVQWSLSPFLCTYMYLCLGPMTYRVIWLLPFPRTHAEQCCNLVTQVSELDNCQPFTTRAFITLSI